MKLIIFLSLLLLISCGASTLQMQNKTKQVTANNVKKDVNKRLVTKNVSQSITTEDISKVDSAVSIILEKYNGYISSSNYDINSEFDAHIKIPSEHLSKSLNAFASIGNEVSRDIKTTDVTAEYIDLNAKIKNLEILKEKVQGILSSTTNINRVMELQKEITELQTQIDGLKGRLNFLKNRVEYSTVHLRIFKELKPGPLTYVGIAIGGALKKLFVWN